MVGRMDHLGIATRSIAVTAEFYQSLGLIIDSTSFSEADAVRTAMIRVGDSAIELLEPTSEESPVWRFLQKHGEGLHHLALEVDDLVQTLDQLKSQDVHLIDSKPRRGAEDRMIAFVHPHSTGGVLIELRQKGEES